MDAERCCVLDRVVAEVKRENSDIPPEEIEAAVTDALDAIRSGRFSE